MPNTPEQPRRPRLRPMTPLLEDVPTGRDTTWAGCEIRADVSGRELEGLDVEGCVLTQAQLTSLHVKRCRIRDSLLVECEASGAILDSSSLVRVEFLRCRLAGAVLSRALLRDVRFVDCKMTGLQLRLADCERVRFETCDLTDADLYGSTLAHACFFDCTLDHVDFSGADLRGARLHGSTLEHARGISALAGSTVSSAQAIPVALQLLTTVGITVDDEREPVPEPGRKTPRAGDSSRRDPSTRA